MRVPSIYVSVRKIPVGLTALRGSQFEVWCNGNTTDFGSVILGSSPDTSTNSRLAGEVEHTNTILTNAHPAL